MKEIVWAIALLLGVALYIANAYCTVEGAVRKNKKIILNNSKWRLLLTFSDYTKAIDRLCVILDIGCLLLVGYWFVITCSGRHELRMSYFEIGNIYMVIDLFGMAYIELITMKENKGRVYHRENYDVEEEEWRFQVNENTYRSVYSFNKKRESRATIVFWPCSYYIFQDVNGFGYGLRKKQFEKLTNIGAYEELSDYLVHKGYATLRIELVREYGVNPFIMQELGERIREFLGEQACENKYFVLLHGPSNRLLYEVYQSMKPAGIISLCGATMSCAAELTQLELWNGRKRINRIKMQVANENPMLFTEEMQRKSSEELMAELVSVADEIPVFVGFAEQDPYYGCDNQEKIAERNHPNIVKQYFKGADFTLRRCNLNKKIHYDGYDVESVFTKRLHPDVVEKICDWLSACVK